MARGRGTAVFEAKPVGARQVAGEMSKAARGLRREIKAEMRHAEDEILDAFVEHAPYDYDERDDTHLQEELEVNLTTGSQIRMTVDSPVRDPRSGYRYTGVTRFGHRGVLRAKRGGMLRWRDAAGWHAAEETAGHHPATDWVEDAMPQADRRVEEAADHLGRVIATRLL